MPVSPRGGRLLFDSAGFPLDVVPQADRRASRLMVGVAVSIALHSLLLWLSPIKVPVNSDGSRALEVSLQSDAPAPVRAVPEPSAPQRPPAATVPRPMMTAPSRSARADVAPQPDPEPETRREPVVESPNDFSSMLEARREQRRAQEDAIAHANSAFRKAEDAQSDKGAQAARRNLAGLGSQQGGTGGVFQIIEKGHRTARYAFNGWQPSRAGGWRETIEVDAGPQGDVDKAIIKSMIALIRKHYQGDFNWDSHRLGRVVTLSARVQDNDGLEEFLIKEFPELNDKPRTAARSVP